MKNILFIAFLCLVALTEVNCLIREKKGRKMKKILKKKSKMFDKCILVKELVESYNGNQAIQTYLELISNDHTVGHMKKCDIAAEALKTGINVDATKETYHHHHFKVNLIGDLAEDERVNLV